MNNVAKPALYGLTPPTIGTFFPENHLKRAGLLTFFVTIISYMKNPPLQTTKLHFRFRWAKNQKISVSKTACSFAHPTKLHLTFFNCPKW
jgi:hypothetical protein